MYQDYTLHPSPNKASLYTDRHQAAVSAPLTAIYPSPSQRVWTSWPLCWWLQAPAKERPGNDQGLIQVRGGNLWFAIQWFFEKSGYHVETKSGGYHGPGISILKPPASLWLIYCVHSSCFFPVFANPSSTHFVGKSHMLLQNKANKSFGNIILLRNIEMLFWECMWHVDNIITVVSDYPYSTPIFIKYPQIIFSCPDPLLSSPLMRWWPGVSAYQLQDLQGHEAWQIWSLR